MLYLVFWVFGLIINIWILVFLGCWVSSLVKWDWVDLVIVIGFDMMNIWVKE